MHFLDKLPSPPSDESNTYIPSIFFDWYMGIIPEKVFRQCLLLFRCGDYEMAYEILKKYPSPKSEPVTFKVEDAVKFGISEAVNEDQL